MVTIDPEQLGKRECYHLLISAIVPRPIALVSTISDGGVVNLAPFSFFNGVSSRPACLSLAIGCRPDGGKKDTLRNIEANKQFVVNSANQWFAERMVGTAAAYPPDISEMEVLNFDHEPAQVVKPPRVREAGFAMECELYDSLQVGSGPGSSTLLVGKILLIHIKEDLYENEVISLEALKPIARLGGASYGEVSGVYDIPIQKR